MPAYYAESSALLKRYKSEVGSDFVVELLEDRTDDEFLITSHFAVLEVQAVVARLMKGNVIRPDEHERIIGTFVQDLATLRSIVVPLYDELVTEALDLLPRYALRAADALHVATALRASRTAGNSDFFVISMITAPSARRRFTGNRTSPTSS